MSKRILIACEESQTITKLFRAKGFEAYSCDIIDCSGGHPEWHYKQDVLPLLKERWDLVIAHRPCTYLSNAGSGWFNEEKYGDKARKRKQLRIEALDFFMKCIDANSDKVCVENPVGFPNSQYRKADQIIHPYHFGDAESKRTCLWLKGLPKLVHTNVVKPKIYAYYKRGKKKGKPIYWSDYKMFREDRGKIRSKTFLGIANAIVNQWSELI